MQCYSCGANIPAHATVCPSCGGPKTKRVYIPLWGILGGLIGSFVGFSIGDVLGAVIGGLAGEVARPLTVLQNEHPVAIEPSNHGTRRSGTQRALGHPGLRFERRAERALDVDGELLPCEHGGGLVGVELIARLRAH